MSSADAASASAAPSPSTSASLLSSTPGTGQVDPPPELHALHPTPSTHVPVHSPTDAVSAVLDSRVGDLATDVCENSFMIVEGESQDDSVDDAIHETVDVQGREGVMVMDNGDDGQQWFPEHENHELKRVKVLLTYLWLSVRRSFPGRAIYLRSLTNPLTPKVYELINSRWVDQGTALCFGQYEDGEAALVAKAETNMSEIILKTTIRSSDVYQRQQGLCAQSIGPVEISVIFTEFVSRYPHCLDRAGWRRLCAQLSGS